MNPSRSLILIILLVGFWGMLVGANLIYTRLFYTAMLVIVLSWLWTRLSLFGIRVERSARSARANVGDVFEERYEVTNNTYFLRPWIEIHNETTLPASAGSRLLTMMRAKQKRSYTARTWLSQRGKFTLGPTVLKAGDPFGLFSVSKKLSENNALVVLPMIFDIPNFLVPAGLLTGGQVIRKKAIDITPHASGVREYVNGDPMKRIHWRTTARRGQLMVKEFEQDPQSEIWLFLDLHRFIQAQLTYQPAVMEVDVLFFSRRPKFKLNPSTYEYVISIGASLAHYFIKQGRSVGLAMAERGYNIIPAERGERQEMKILETLAFVEAGRLSISNLVQAQAGQPPQGSSAVIITPSVSLELIGAVDELQRRNLRPMIILIDPQTFGGSKGSDKIINMLALRNIPFCIVQRDDDIGAALSDIVNQARSKETPAWQKPALSQ